MGLFVTKSFPWWARVREERHAPRDPLNPFTEDARQLATADRYFSYPSLRLQPCFPFSQHLSFLELDLYFLVASSSVTMTH
jgi:hypothetical protein